MADFRHVATGEDQMSSASESGSGGFEKAKPVRRSQSFSARLAQYQRAAQETSAPSREPAPRVSTRIEQAGPSVACVSTQSSVGPDAERDSTAADTEDEPSGRACHTSFCASFSKFAAVERASQVSDVGSAKRRSSVASTNATGGGLEDLADVTSRVMEGDPELSWLDLSRHLQLSRCSQEQKSAFLRSIASAPALETLLLNGVGLDNSNADAIVHLLRTNKKLEGLSLEANRLTEPALVAIAEELPSSSLSELVVANQHRDLSTDAIQKLLKAMEATPTLVSLGLGKLRDDAVRRQHQRVTMTNTEAMRVRRQQAAAAAARGAPAPACGKALRRRSISFDRSVKTSSMNKPVLKKELSLDLRKKLALISPVVEKLIDGTTKADGTAVQIDWSEEARRIAHNEPLQYSEAAGSASGGVESRAASSTYILTGSASWERATDEERIAVVGAFATNTSVRTLSLAAAAVNDRLATECAKALRVNRSLTSLNLESNTISTAGITALASALTENRSLRELRLANQMGRPIAHAAEETFASALSEHRGLTRVTLFDLKSIRARDLIAKAVDANQERERRERRSRGDAVSDCGPSRHGADYRGEGGGEASRGRAVNGDSADTCSQSDPALTSRSTSDDIKSMSGLEHTTLQRAKPSRRRISRQPAVPPTPSALAELADANASAPSAPRQSAHTPSEARHATARANVAAAAIQAFPRVSSLEGGNAQPTQRTMRAAPAASARTDTAVPPQHTAAPVPSPSPSSQMLSSSSSPAPSSLSSVSTASVGRENAHPRHADAASATATAAAAATSASRAAPSSRSSLPPQLRASAAPPQRGPYAAFNPPPPPPWEGRDSADSRAGASGGSNSPLWVPYDLADVVEDTGHSQARRQAHPQAHPHPQAQAQAQAHVQAHPHPHAHTHAHAHSYPERTARAQRHASRDVSSGCDSERRRGACKSDHAACTGSCDDGATATSLSTSTSSSTSLCSSASASASARRAARHERRLRASNSFDRRSTPRDGAADGAPPQPAAAGYDTAALSANQRRTAPQSAGAVRSRAHERVAKSVQESDHTQATHRRSQGNACADDEAARNLSFII